LDLVAGKELKQLFRAYGERDDRAFRVAAQQIIEGHEAQNHLGLARDLRRILDGSLKAEVNAELALAPTQTHADLELLPRAPVDREGQFPLAELRRPQRHLEDLILPADIVNQIESVADEFRMWDVIDRSGLPRRQRLLFYGAPGTGKTSAAEAMANILGIPLLTVRLDSVVSSFLGETATNIDRVFDFAAQESFVLLFDEFDALGKARDDPSEHGEIKRVVNAFLQMLDRFRGRSLIVASTNHEQLLDTALWRRFDEVIEFPKPNLAQIKRILRLRLRPVESRSLNFDAAANHLKDLPPSAVEKAALDARRYALLAGRRQPTQDDLDRAVVRVRGRPWQ
jgi:hypothetical protein